jgi:RNA polymerase sigma factor (sigma-70 family)
MSLEERFLEKNEAISAKHADKETKITLEQALAELEKSNPRMASIIRQRYEEGRTLTEIGQEYGFTKQAIYQIEEKALEKLRKFMETGKM